MSNRRLSVEEEDGIIRHYTEGMSALKVSKIFGTSHTAVKDVLVRRGIPLNQEHQRANPTKRTLTPEQEQEIATLYEAGVAANAIAVAKDIPVTTVRRTLTRLDVKKNPAFDRPDPMTEEEIELAVGECLDGATFDEVAELIGVSKQTVARNVWAQGVKLGRGRRPRLCTLNEDAFDTITPVSARWMGFLFADGCLPKAQDGQQPVAMNLGAKDRGHIEQFRDFLGSNHAIVELRNKERVISKDGKPTPPGKAFGYRVRSNRLANALMSHGMVKSDGSKHDPGPLLEDNPAFWAGMIDGDGSIGNAVNRGHLYPYFMLCGHVPVLLKFKAFLSRCGIGNFNIVPTQSGIFQIETMGSRAASLIEMLYTEDSAPAGLKRKIDRSRQILRGEQVELYEGPVAAVIDP